MLWRGGICPMTHTRRPFRECLTTTCQLERMKHILAAFAFALTAIGPAHADTLAAQVKAEAQRLLVQVSAAESAGEGAAGRQAADGCPCPCVGPAAVQPRGQSVVGRNRPAGWRPTDLRCIFRGMAEETGKQLDAAAKATTGGDQAKAYARLTHMLNDAVEIAPAVGGNATAASLCASGGGHVPCVEGLLAQFW